MSLRSNRSVQILAIVLAASSACGAVAQSTDGFHTLQVIPIVVDSTSFVQQFHFSTPWQSETKVAVRFHPATGGGNATAPIECPGFVIPHDTTRISFPSLRALCPGLGPGSHFGMLALSEDSPDNKVFGVFSRVSNPQGIGFSVEAFPPHVFGPYDAVVSGLRRRAATGSSPAFQTNCFVAALGDLAVPATGPATVYYFVGAGGKSGAGILTLSPGQVVRLLDVFAGMPAGDYEDGVFRVRPIDKIPVAAFCTVQDNTSFGADFRIAKPVDGPQCVEQCGDGNLGDATALRETLASRDMHIPGTGSSAPEPQFFIPAGPKHQNSHVLYFKHPDQVQCELVLPFTNERVPDDYGLEMRLIGNLPGIVAGGDGVTGFGEIYMGDRDAQAPTNTRYLVQVESDEINESKDRPYWLRCKSGSGHTRGETILYQAPIDDF